MTNETTTSTKKEPHPRSIDGQAAKHGVSRGTLYNEIKRGHLETTKIGRRRIVTEQQEAAWLARGQAQEG